MSVDPPNRACNSCKYHFTSTFTFILSIDLPPAPESPHGSGSPSSQHSRSSSPSGLDVLTLRALVSTEDADVIAGKDDEGAANLREQTGVKVDVSENLPGIHERVISISGSVESVAEVCSHIQLGCSCYLIPDPFQKGICAHRYMARQSKPIYSYRLHRCHRLHLLASLSLTQTHGHHHRPGRTQNKGHSGWLRCAYGRFQTDASQVNRASCRHSRLT